MKTALIHYWLVNDRGGEKVLAKFAEQFPDAELFTHVYDPSAMPESIRRMNIRTPFIQKLPFAKTFYKNYLPLMPWALSRLDLSGYDLIISSESGPAKGIRKPPGATHICYCHTPMRYLWDLSDEYARNASLLQKIGMKIFRHWLRKWDLWSATQVDYFIANSQFVAERIQRIYNRDAEILYPPVDVEHFSFLQRDPQDFYLFFGQLTAYKHADIAIKAFAKMGKKLIVAGDGEQMEFLKQLATRASAEALTTAGHSFPSTPPGLRTPLRRRGIFEIPSSGGGPERRGGSLAGNLNISFLGRVSDEKRDELYSQAKALIFPGIEDFGMVPVEAQAAGCPVIAFRGGGALETVVENQTGLFFDEQTPESLKDTVVRFESMKLDAQVCRKNAQKFSVERFKSEFSQFVDDCNLDKMG